MPEVYEKDVLFLFGPSYECGWGRAQNTVRELGGRTRVLYVELPPRLSGMFKSMRSKSWFGRRLEKAGDNVWILRSLGIPFGRFRLIDRLNIWILRWWIRKVLKRLEFRVGLVWFYETYGAALLGEFECELQLCDFASPPRYLKGIVPRRAVPLRIKKQEKLAEGADLVFTETARHADELRKLNPRTFCSPSGVDLSLFRLAKDESTQVPCDLETIPSPRLGFVGHVQNWVNIQAMSFVAEQHPDWSIVIIGRAVVDVGNLGMLPNVFLLGERPYKSLPSYAKGMDVLLLPYKWCEATEYSDSPKILQYLATGKPVVSWSFPTAERYRDVVRVVDSLDAFEEAIHQSLMYGSPGSDEAVEQRLSERSWDLVVKRALERIGHVAREKGKGD